MERNRYLTQLLDVIRVLRGSEADLAKKHLIAYETNHTAKRRKMFQLYKYIKINDIEDYAKLKKKISPDSTDDSFNKLIRRTTGRIQESLIVDVNIRRKDAYNEVFRMKFFLRKQLMQAEILMSRGLATRPRIIFDNSIRIAKKYELYDELIESTEFKQRLVYDTQGIKAFRQVVEELDFYEKCRYYLRKTKRIQTMLEVTILQKSFVGKINKSQKNDINKILDYYEETKSANILSYYYLLKLRIAKIESNLNEVSMVIKSLIDLVSNSSALYSIARISFLKRELANVEFTKMDFEVALVEIENAIGEIKKDGMLYVGLQTRKLEILILLSRYQEVFPVIEEFSNLKFIEKYPYQQSLINYNKAIAHFGLLEYKQALNLLSQKNETEKDKEGWNVWIRIMRILCSIELLKLNMIDYDVESFRKYLQRTAKQYEVRERDKLILNVLMELDKQSYNFEATSVEKEKELNLLKSTDKKFAWNPDSPEMILFHEWFEAKRLKMAYLPNFEVYREARKN
ncbi:MAG: hypothetical protein JKY48_12525 [Flavobacteriales bacterium]|nr:hypothetical protein [Flavobacteriales bacterium]